MLQLRSKDIPPLQGSPFKRLQLSQPVAEDEDIMHDDSFQNESLPPSMRKVRSTIKSFAPYSTMKTEQVKEIEEQIELKRRETKLAFQIWYIRAVQKMLPFQQILKNKERIVQLLSLKLRPKQLHKKSTLKDIHERIAQADQELALLFKKYEIDDALGGAEAPSMAALIRVPYKTEVFLKTPIQLERVKGKEIKKLNEDMGQNLYKTFHEQSAQELEEKKKLQEARLKDKLRLLKEGFL